MFKGPENQINKIESRNILESHSLKQNETLIVFQRHQEHEKNSTSPEHGKLTPKGREAAKEESSERLIKLIETIPESERQKIFFLVLGSDSTYPGKGARAMETGTIFSEEVIKILEKYNIDKNNFLNYTREYRNTGQGMPRPTARLRISPDIDKSSPFGSYLAELYPENSDFVQAFDRDKEKDVRLEMNAEGPEETADRLKKFLIVLQRYSAKFHEANPDSRLIIFNFTHYDTISPFVKKELLKEPIGDRYLPVDFGAGISVTIDNDGKMKTRINEVDYELTKE